MAIQVIHSLHGHPEYVLLPIGIYRALQTEIERKFKETMDYIPFVIEDYLKNPVAVTRIKAGITQKTLVSIMSVSQAYISKLEKQSIVSNSALQKVTEALAKLQQA